MSQSASSRLDAPAHGNADRVSHEFPNNRRFIRIVPDLMARIGERSYPVIDLSIGGLALRMSPTELPANPPFPCDIFLPGNEEMPLAAVLIQPASVQRQCDRVGFRIDETDGGARLDLHRLVMSHLEAGTWHDPSFAPGEIAAAGDGSPTLSPAPPDQNRHPVRRWAGYAAWMALVILLLAAVGLNVFDAMFGVRSVSATVAAPAAFVRAPQSGFVHSRGVQVGDAIARDQHVLTIRNPDLETEFAVARAQVEAGEEHFDSEENLRVARIRLAALELQRANNRLYSPCDCIVLDIDGAYGGEWSQAGDRLMTLVPRDPDDMLVYALVPADKVQRLGAGQKVVVSFPMTGETVGGAIEDILMRNRTARWAGLPYWYAQSAGNVGVLVRPAQPLSAQAVGQPAEISTANITLREFAAAMARYVTIAENRIGTGESR